MNKKALLLLYLFDMVYYEYFAAFRVRHCQPNKALNINIHKMYNELHKLFVSVDSLASHSIPINYVQIGMR